jgi:hypothetical protein
MVKLYPNLLDLPTWLVDHIRPQIQRAITALHAADQSDERIAELIANARDGQMEIPASARDVTAFLQSAYDLAHIQWALTLEKAKAIGILAGKEAAKNYQRSKSGNEARLKATEADRRERNQRIRLRANELRQGNQKLSNNDIARKLAGEFSIGFRQIKRVLTDPA